MGAHESANRLAAIVFDVGEDPDTPLREFVVGARSHSIKVSGLMQERCEPLDGCDLHDVRVRDLDTGSLLPIMQNLGAQSEGCRVDPAAIAAAASMLDAARERKPDLLVVNRFGRLESEGGGMIAEIGEAVASGQALLICVPRRYLEAWNDFAQGLDVQLPPTRPAVEAWWASVAPQRLASGA
jgi:hypothetical protein